MKTFESLQNEIPEQCKGCPKLEGYLAFAQDSAEKLTKIAIIKATTALELPTTSEDAQQVQLYQTRLANPYECTEHEVSGNEFERRMAGLLLRTAEFRENQLIAESSATLAALAVECTAKAGCQL